MGDSSDRKQKLTRARGKLKIIRVFGAGAPTQGTTVMKAMSDALQQQLDSSIDLYAVDVAKWIRVFLDSLVLERCDIE